MLHGPSLLGLLNTAQRSSSLADLSWDCCSSLPSTGHRRPHSPKPRVSESAEHPWAPPYRRAQGGHLQIISDDLLPHTLHLFLCPSLQGLSSAVPLCPLRPFSHGTSSSWDAEVAFFPSGHTLWLPLWSPHLHSLSVLPVLSSSPSAFCVFSSWLS